VTPSFSDDAGYHTNILNLMDVFHCPPPPIRWQNIAKVTETLPQSMLVQFDRSTRDVLQQLFASKPITDQIALSAASAVKAPMAEAFATYIHHVCIIFRFNWGTSYIKGCKSTAILYRFGCRKEPN
jgi:hypothetical protein